MHRRAASTNSSLCTHGENLAWRDSRDRIENLRNEGLQVANAVALRADQDYADRMGCEVLLKAKVLIHRDENLKLLCGLSQQGTIL